MCINRPTCVLAAGVLACSVGVSSEPQHVQLDLTAADKLLILASDGVWEFISSKEAVELVGSCDTPEEACRAVSNSHSFRALLSGLFLYMLQFAECCTLQLACQTCMHCNVLLLPAAAKRLYYPQSGCLSDAAPSIELRQDSHPAAKPSMPSRLVY